MAHNRKLVLGAVALTKAKVRGDMPVMKEVRDELEQLLVKSCYLDGAPFRWVGVILRYGLKNDTKPVYEKINEKEGDLPLAIEIDTSQLVDADHDSLKRQLTVATLNALIDAGHKYSLKVSELEEERRRTSSAPG
jgi:Immunity protein 39